MLRPGNGDPQFYEVRLTEPAEIELEAEYSRLADLVSLEYADRWRDGLVSELDRLALFPTGYEVAPENDRYDVEVRCLLYFGPSRRHSGPIYRVLFYMVEPSEDETIGLVRVLHVWHAAQKPTA